MSPASRDSCSEFGHLTVLIKVAEPIAIAIRAAVAVPLPFGPTAPAPAAGQSPDDKQAAFECLVTKLADFSVMAAVPQTDRHALLAAALAVPRASRAMGALVGLAVGDALGASLEFLPAVDTPGPSKFDAEQWKLVGPERTDRRLELRPGQCVPTHHVDKLMSMLWVRWTDDTSMALCIADSLLTGMYNGSDIRMRFWNWWYRCAGSVF